jgi:hypothetical protein
MTNRLQRPRSICGIVIGSAFVANVKSLHRVRIFNNWRGRDGNDPSVDIAKDADQRF